MSKTEIDPDEVATDKLICPECETLQKLWGNECCGECDTKLTQEWTRAENYQPLEPCPFCGEKAELTGVQSEGGVRIFGNTQEILDAVWVKCTECNTNSPHGESVEDAVSSWNYRPKEDQS